MIYLVNQGEFEVTRKKEDKQKEQNPIKQIRTMIGPSKLETKSNSQQKIQIKTGRAPKY